MYYTLLLGVFVRFEWDPHKAQINKRKHGEEAEFT
jgi:uncharacterized DUF497 family protein